ncbi:sensor histidine kinase [Mangrovibrevibacter kandeliae]|uniref:sensor histidine kinase n=1 Tax=Mangrovibrevibacter kandeliae TaxID=2968473 RepID=UPI002119730E|nr:sensor histidine kinase [Aurantimonas sp. CSK15Z-1]
MPLDLQEVLIHAPFRNDARMLASLLETHAIQSTVCPDEEALAEGLGAGLPGALIFTQEALTDRVRALVQDHLARQPDWSELTVIVLVEKGVPQALLLRHLTEQWPGSRQVFYQRPLATLELLSGVQSALLARIRQRDVRDHIALERELRHELNHRVKNILASVSSIFQMTARASADLDELKRSFGGRLATLGNVHSALFEAGGEAVDLKGLITLVLSPYAANGGAHFEIDGPAVRLNKDAAAGLGLTVHELATNAIKYGAWSVPTGLIRVEWSVEAREFRLCWRETGGPALARPSRSGYGTRYVRAAMQNLFGAPPEVRFEPSGLVLVAHGPLSRIDAMPATDRNASATVGG